MDASLLTRAERLLKEHVQPDIVQTVERDRELLGALCGRLGLVLSSANMAHLATLLRVMGIDTKQEYPKAIYDDKGKLLGTANDAKEERALKPADLTEKVAKVLDAPAPGEGQSL